MSGYVTAGCCSCGPIRARRRRWCLTPTTGPSRCSRAPADAAPTTTGRRGWRRSLSARAASTIAASCRCAAITSSIRVACTPASGWKKGQVENQVGLVRERFFTPRLRFKSYDEMNAWLLDKCIAYAKAHRHPELTEQTIWEVFEAERLTVCGKTYKLAILLSGEVDGFGDGSSFGPFDRSWTTPRQVLGCGSDCRQSS